MWMQASPLMCWMLCLAFTLSADCQQWLTTLHQCWRWALAFHLHKAQSADSPTSCCKNCWSAWKKGSTFTDSLHLKFSVSVPDHGQTCGAAPTQSVNSNRLAPWQIVFQRKGQRQTVEARISCYILYWLGHKWFEAFHLAEPRATPAPTIFGVFHQSVARWYCMLKQRRPIKSHVTINTFESFHKSNTEHSHFQMYQFQPFVCLEVTFGWKNKCMADQTCLGKFVVVVCRFDSPVKVASTYCFCICEANISRMLAHAQPNESFGRAFNV